MDYKQMAAEFMKNMQLPGKARQVKGFGDMHSEAAILMYINLKKEILPKDISAAMGVSTARIAIALNELEKKGFVTREIDENDRRRIIVRVTPKGKDFSEEQRQVFIDRTAEIFEELGEHDTLEYIRITERITGIMRKRQ